MGKVNNGGAIYYASAWSCVLAFCEFLLLLGRCGR